MVCVVLPFPPSRPPQSPPWAATARTRSDQRPAARRYRGSFDPSRCPECSPSSPLRSPERERVAVKVTCEAKTKVFLNLYQAGCLLGPRARSPAQLLCQICSSTRRICSSLRPNPKRHNHRCQFRCIPALNVSYLSHLMVRPEQP